MGYFLRDSLVSYIPATHNYIFCRIFTYLTCKLKVQLFLSHPEIPDMAFCSEGIFLGYDDVLGAVVNSTLKKCNLRRQR